MSILKKCKNKACSILFEPIKSIQPYCFNCTIERAKKHVKKQRDKKERAEKKELKEKLKTVSDYKSDLQDLVNKIARLIDYGQNCISCNCVPKKSNGCHFKSVGSHSKLRYNLLNIYLGCNKCNSELGGNVHGYDDGIIAHFGREFWEYIKFKMVLDCPNLKIDIPELKEKIKISRDIIKELESNLIVLSDEDRIKKE